MNGQLEAQSRPFRAEQAELSYGCGKELVAPFRSGESPSFTKEFFKLWIVGANGFVGKVFSSKVEGVKSGREVDITDLEKIRAFIRAKGPFTHIVNCAALSEVDLAESRVEEAFRLNAQGPENLGLVASEMGAKFLHLSTDYVFDGKERVPLKEEAEPNPCNVYGKSKWEGEERLFSVFPEACILRTSWIFGSEGKNFVAKLLPLLETQEELKLVFDQTSKPTYVHDLAAAILALLNESGLFHFANSEATNKYEFSLVFREIAEKMGFPIRCKKIIPVLSSEFSSPAKRPLYSALDTGKISQKISIRPWKECIEEYLRAKT